MMKLLLGLILINIMSVTWAKAMECYSCHFFDSDDIEPTFYLGAQTEWTKYCIMDDMEDRLVSTERGDICYYGIFTDMEGYVKGAWRGAINESMNPYPDFADAWKDSVHIFLYRQCITNLCNNVNNFAINTKPIPTTLIGTFLLALLFIC